MRELWTILWLIFVFLFDQEKNKPGTAQSGAPLNVQKERSVLIIQRPAIYYHTLYQHIPKKVPLRLENNLF